MAEQQFVHCHGSKFRVEGLSGRRGLFATLTCLPRGISFGYIFGRDDLAVMPIGREEALVRYRLRKDAFVSLVGEE